MAPSFDYAVSSLLCAEDNTSIFDEVDDNYYDGVVVVDDFHEISNNLQQQQQHENPQNNFNIIITSTKINNNNNNNQEQNFDYYYSGIFVPSDECLASFFDKESHHFLGLDYLKRFRNGDLDLCARNQAIDWILKVQSYYNFGPLCVCLSVNYLDRFLSAYELPKGKTWMMQLLAVACLSLAAKLEETDVPLSLDLQVGDSKYVFEAKTIQRMELLVLSTLKWRMQSVTPFSFIDFYLYKLSGDKMPPRSVVFQAIQLILTSIKGIELMEFRPSEIAAAVAISVTQETVELTDKAFSFITHNVEKERMIKCVEIMHELRMNSRIIMNNGNGYGYGYGYDSYEYGTTTTANNNNVPQSPIGVLDAAACLSYDDTSTTTTTTTTTTAETATPSGSCANSAHSSPASSAPAPKRRKLDNLDLI